MSQQSDRLSTRIEDLTSQEIFHWRLLDLGQREGRPFTISSNATVARSPQRIVFPEQLEPGRDRLVRKLHRERKMPKLMRRACARTPEQSRELHWDGVEVGAFHLELLSGEVHTAIHTSASLDAIEARDVIQSVNGLIESREILPHQIRSLEYFHTHPSRPGQIADPISASDEELIFLIREQLHKELGERTPPVHLYAIASMENRLFLYHLAA